MILTAGLTPAWQRVLVFDAFRLDEVNRAARAEACASGKSLNVAVALHRLGAPVRTVGLAGGTAGRAIRHEIGELGLDARWIDASSPTRTCTTVLAEGRTTELVENAGPVTAEELEAFRTACRDTEAGTVVLTGSLPRGTPETFYRDALDGRRTILDARGPELLHALAKRPFLVKPNRRELEETLGRALGDGKAVRAAMAEIRERGAEWVVVTDGPGPVMALGPEGLRTLHPPAVKAVNPIGSGDSVAAGIARELDRGGDPVEGLRLGIAAAAQNATGFLPGRIDPAEVTKLAKTVRVE